MFLSGKNGLLGGFPPPGICKGGVSVGYGKAVGQFWKACDNRASENCIMRIQHGVSWQFPYLRSAEHNWHSCLIDIRVRLSWVTGE